MSEALATRVVEEFAAARPLAAPLLTEQTAREIERVERLRRLSSRDCAYVLCLDGDGAARGFLPVYPAAGTAQLGSIGRMPSWASARGARRDETVKKLFAAGFAEATRRGANRVDAPLLHDDQLAPVLAAARTVAPDARPLQRVTHEGVIDITFATFEGYVASLPARQRMVRRQRRRFLESTLDLVEVSLTDAAAELAPLLHQVETKYGHDVPVDEHATYLWTAGAAMGRHSRTLVAVEDRRPVAFSCVWDQGDGWRMRFWGCDYGVAAVRDACAYFNLNYYEPLVRAGRAGVTCLMLGTESLPAKQDRGAWLRRLTSVELC